MTKTKEEQDNDSKIYEACLDILKRTPPQSTEQNLAGLVQLLYSQENHSIKDKVCQNVVVPLEIKIDTLSDGKQFLACKCNQVGNCHRSPYSNHYFPTPSEKVDDDDVLLPKPSKFLRDMELSANDIFQSYRTAYYGRGSNSVSSVYFWNSDNNNANFASGAFLIQKEVEESEHVHSGSWNSIHVVDIGKPISKEKGSQVVEYKLSTTIFLFLQPKVESSLSTSSSTDLSGTLHRNDTNTCSFTDNLSSKDTIQNHLINLGKMIENMEIDLRSKMDQLYLQKTKEIMEIIRYDRQPQKMMPMFGGASSRGNISAVLAARASKKNVGGDSSSAFNIGAAAAARASSIKKKPSNQASNDIMKNHAMLLNEALLKRNKNQS